jgi:hypothetical protein
MSVGAKIKPRTRAEPMVRELAHREAVGIEVSLLWRRADGAVIVQLVEVPSGVVFELRVAPEDALDAFHHPYAYFAGCRPVLRDEPVAA